MAEVTLLSEIESGVAFHRIDSPWYREAMMMYNFEVPTYDTMRYGVLPRLDAKLRAYVRPQASQLVIFASYILKVQLTRPIPDVFLFGACRSTVEFEGSLASVLPLPQEFLS